MVPVDTSEAAVTAVRYAAIAVHIGGATDANVTAFLAALEDTNFTDYNAKNSAAYVLSKSDFMEVTTVDEVNAAIESVNQGEGATAVIAVNAAAAGVDAGALTTALEDNAFVNYYIAATDAAYWEAKATFIAGVADTVVEVNAAIAVVNAAQ
ncbi:hypothetical protein ES708_34768 [subsurface metagenome]